MEDNKCSDGMKKDEKCGSEKCDDGYCDMSREMACLADKAWMCLMMDKMKKAWDAKRGPTMDKVADVAVEHSMAVWKVRKEAQDMCKKPSQEMIDEYKKKLGEAMQD
jgi:hypothetical protein